ncbi:MAG: hypothetical protein ABUL64_00305, partial [Singulisphaera sp.]
AQPSACVSGGAVMHTAQTAPRPATILLRTISYCLAALLAWFAFGGSWTDNTVPALFGWQRLLVVQVLLSIPAGGLCGMILSRSIDARRCLTLAIVAGVLGLGLAIAVAWFVPLLGAAFSGIDGGFWWLAVARAALCLTVIVPLAVAIEALCHQVAEDKSETSLAPGFVGPWAMVAALVAVALPAVYALDLCRKQATQAADLLDRRQLVAAARQLERLRAIGSSYPLHGAALPDMARKVARSVAALEERVARLDPQALDPDATVDAARSMAMLDRGEAARQLLTPLADSRADASLLLAALLQERKDWEESTASYERAVQLLRDAPDARGKTAGMVQAFDGLAYNAREVGQYREAEEYYLLGLRELPDAAAHFHFQLGRHHHAGGRPVRAIEHLQAAVTLGPEAYGQQAAAIIRQLAAGSPGCLLGSPAPAHNRTTPLLRGGP